MSFKSGERECKACGKKLDENDVVKCPIDIEPAKVEVTRQLLCQATHVFVQPVSNLEIVKGLRHIPEIIKYDDEIVFCSYDHMNEYLKKNFEIYRLNRRDRKSVV